MDLMGLLTRAMNQEQDTIKKLEKDLLIANSQLRTILDLRNQVRDQMLLTPEAVGELIDIHKRYGS